MTVFALLGHAETNGAEIRAALNRISKRLPFMMTSRALASFTLATSLVLTTGCGVIVSQQDYGSPGSHQISAGRNKADVFANMGVPNSIYRVDDLEIFVYEHYEGQNILGLFAEISRQDTVVVMDDDGEVLTVNLIDVGEGMSIIASPFVDATHPVRTSELRFEPTNYTHEMGED